MHCLEEFQAPEGWSSDACPACKAKGHSDEWRVGTCEACNREYFAKMDELKAGVDRRAAFLAPLGITSHRQLREKLTELGCLTPDGRWID
jgi:hypothetical protein